MSDIAEEILAAISEREDFAQIKDADGISDPDSWHTRSCGYLQGELIEPCECDVPAEILRRCAVDRKMVGIYKGALVAVEVSKGTILAGATKLRLGAYQKMIDQLARGYGIQP